MENWKLVAMLIGTAAIGSAMGYGIAHLIGQLIPHIVIQ